MNNRSNREAVGLWSRSTLPVRLFPWLRAARPLAPALPHRRGEHGSGRSRCHRHVLRAKSVEPVVSQEFGLGCSAAHAQKQRAQGRCIHRIAESTDEIAWSCPSGSKHLVKNLGTIYTRFLWQSSKTLPGSPRGCPSPFGRCSSLR